MLGLEKSLGGFCYRVVGPDFSTGKSIENNDKKGRILVAKEAKGHTKIVVQFGNLAIIVKICLLVPSSLKNKLEEWSLLLTSIAHYFCRSIIELTHRAALLPEAFSDC